MIELIQGTPGSGKSAVALLNGLLHLMAGGVVASNFDLIEGWAERLAERNIWVRIGLKNKKKLAQSYYDRFFKIGSVGTIYELSKKIDGLVLKQMKLKREGKALLILDESQLYFNSRNWKDNFSFIEFFTQHRKLGFNIILVAHSIEMIDKQVRPLIEICSFFRNLKNIRVPIIGISLSLWCNIFFVVRKYAGLGPGSGLKHSMDTFILDKTSAGLYDTCEVFAFNNLTDTLSYQGRSPSEPVVIDPPKIISHAECFPPYHQRITPHPRYVDVA